MPVNRVLFVELLGGIGDLIFALPSIDALQRTYPSATLDVLTFAPSGELLIGDPRVHEVFFARRGHGDAAESILQQDVSAVLRTYPYDLIVSDTRHSGLHELIEGTRAPRKVTQLWSGAGVDEPISDLFVRRLREEGIVDAQVAALPIKVYLSEDERGAAAAIWSSLDVARERVVVLNPHSGAAVKRWPVDYFAILGQALAADGWTIAVLAADGPELAWQIATLIPDARFIPKMSLRLTAACLEGAGLVVSADSGVGHLASAVGTPVLAIYGPTWAGRYGVAAPSLNLQSPFDCPERQPMNFTVQRCWFSGQCVFPGKTNCCEDVTPSAALAAARELLADGPHSLPLSIGDGEGSRTFSPLNLRWRGAGGEARA